MSTTFNDLIGMHDLDQKVIVKKALESLTPRMQFVVIRRFFQNQTLSSIAEEIGLSEARLYQIERKALCSLKRGFRRNKI
jgi:RNA polymerase sigma factor (sigma-70 family)